MAGTLLPPPLDDRYTYVSLLGHGGEALVHHVRDRQGRDLVVKVYVRDPAARRDVWDRLERLRHPALMPLLEWGVSTDGRAYETMPLLTGGSVADRGRLGFAAVFQLVGQLVGGINQLHEAEIVHRDLKPVNLLFRDASGDEVVIADFGISGALDGATATQMMTPGYAPPEAYEGVVRPAWDWWSLGMTVRQVATGAQPFAGLPVEAVQRRIRDEGVDLTQLPARLRTLCAGLLQRDPARRWGSGQVLEWLDEVGSRPVVQAPTERVARIDPVPPKAPVDAQQVKAPPTREAASAPKSPPAGKAPKSPSAGPTPQAGGLRVAGESYSSMRAVLRAGRKRPDQIAQSLFAAARWSTAGAGRPEVPRWIMAHGGDPDLLDRLGRSTPLVGLNLLLARFDAKRGPVMSFGTVALPGLVQMAINATRDGAGPDSGKLVQVYGQRLLPVFALFPGYEGLAPTDAKWRALVAAWEAEAARHPSMPEELRTAGTVVRGALLSAALPSVLTSAGAAALARFSSGPGEGAPDWYGAMVAALGGPGSLGGFAVQAVCGPAVAAEKVKPPPGPGQAAPVPSRKPGAAKTAPRFVFDGTEFLTKEALGDHLLANDGAGVRLVNGDLDALKAWARRMPDPAGRWAEIERRIGSRLNEQVRFFYLVMWLKPETTPNFLGKTAVTPGWVSLFVSVLNGSASPQEVGIVVWLGSTAQVLDAYAGSARMSATLKGAQERYDELLRLWKVSVGKRADELPDAARTRSPELMAALLLASLRDPGAEQALALLAADRSITEVIGNLGWFFGMAKDLGGRNTPGGRAVWVANAPTALALVEKRRQQLAAKARKQQATAKQTQSKPKAKQQAPTKSAKQQPSEQRTPKKKSAPARPSVPPKPRTPPQVPPVSRAKVVWELLLGRRTWE